MLILVHSITIYQCLDIHVWASCQIHTICPAHALGMPGTFSTPPRVNDPDMYQATCVTHVSWCMMGSLTTGFLRSRWWRKRSRHPRRFCNPQFWVPGHIDPYWSLFMYLLYIISVCLYVMQNIPGIWCLPFWSTALQYGLVVILIVSHIGLFVFNS